MTFLRLTKDEIQKLPVVFGHCRDCSFYKAKAELCEKYNMLSKPYQTCKSCTGTKS